MLRFKVRSLKYKILENNLFDAKYFYFFKLLSNIIRLMTVNTFQLKLLTKKLYWYLKSVLLLLIPKKNLQVKKSFLFIPFHPGVLAKRIISIHLIYLFFGKLVRNKNLFKHSVLYSNYLFLTLNIKNISLRKKIKFNRRFKYLKFMYK